MQGEVTTCRACKRSLRLVPVVMLDGEEEKRRFEAIFSTELAASVN